MYFIVTILPWKINVVVPKNWIREIDHHVEKFFNSGMNRSQKFYCYWTNDSTARGNNGILRLDFEPDFSAPFSPIFPAEGCYQCVIRKAKANYVDAENYANKLRSLPAIYNPNRMFERPIPVVPDLSEAIFLSTPRETPGSNEQPTERSNTVTIDSSLLTVRPVDSVHHAIVQPNCPNEVLGNSSTVDLPRQSNNLVDDANAGCSHWEQPTDNSQQPTTNDTTDGQPDFNISEQKPNIQDLVQDVSSENANEIGSLLFQGPAHVPLQVEYDDDIVITYSIFPRPIAAPACDLIKRENDLISGDISFNENEKGRIYQIGNLKYVISTPVIEKFISWNSNESERNDVEIDKLFVHALLLVLVSREKLAASDVNADIIGFIKSLMAVRSNQDPNGDQQRAEERVDAVPKYVQLFCDAKKSEATTGAAAQVVNEGEIRSEVEKQT